ncbi:hypothetical protein P43SY_005012 [Pythium insidiosum]|uniref:Translation elongation factor IF5A C-terminal domain-containing protein n=1 Tax=Pythium insidiosum TaxID=114742 RepID=A0AAD5LRQ2_PYTIN|nr:hypothetical protein P43SY_005012 [Pythium insidiosum]
MDSRCIKFWEDGQALVKSVGSSDASRVPQLMGKMVKELRTISRFLQKNQSQRFSDNAQQKVVDAIAAYVTFTKQHVPMATPDEKQLAEATFQAVKDGLAMPFSVFGSKQKKRLFKWYNELIGVVGGDADDALLQMAGMDGSADAAAAEKIEWSVLGIDEDGYLSLLNEETGETCETFQVKKKSAEFKRIQKALEDSDVTVATVGDTVVDIRVSEA